MITYSILFKGLSLLGIFCDAKLHLAILPILRSFSFLCLSLKKLFEWHRYPQIQKYGKYNMDTNESISELFSAILKHTITKMKRYLMK